MGKVPSTLSPFPLTFLFSAMVSGGMVSSSSSAIGSSYIFGCSLIGSFGSLPLKKREGWLCDVMGVLGRNFPKFSLFL